MVLAALYGHEITVPKNRHAGKFLAAVYTAADFFQISHLMSDTQTAILDFIYDQTQAQTVFDAAASIYHIIPEKNDVFRSRMVSIINRNIKALFGGEDARVNLQALSLNPILARDLLANQAESIGTKDTIAQEDLEQRMRCSFCKQVWIIVNRTHDKAKVASARNGLKRSANFAYRVKSGETSCPRCARKASFPSDEEDDSDDSEAT